MGAMLRLIDWSEECPDRAELAARMPRARIDLGAAVEVVRPIMDDVASRGAAACREWSARLDGVSSSRLRVAESFLAEALASLDPEVRQALEIAIEHARAGHAAQLPREVRTEIVPGGAITQRWIPVRRVGLYVPGGLAVYPSSVVMNAVAAQVAGVQEIALVSPPQEAFGGTIHPTIAAACALLGIKEVYACGGAQGIGLLAYGSREDEQVAPVDVITGPGNIYVAAAKRIAQATCGIDAEAGTTEIAIIADETANPDWVAADLISQAEHDPAAASVLITTSETLIAEVEDNLARRVGATRHEERVRKALSGPQSGAILVADLDSAIEVANAYAAEHLEIQCVDAESVAARIDRAGAIFVGPYTPVPAGDYVAGSNHVLPTGGTARYASGLSVMTYLKPVQQVSYTREALEAITRPLVALATSEDLPAHAESATARFPRH